MFFVRIAEVAIRLFQFVFEVNIYLRVNVSDAAIFRLLLFPISPIDSLSVISLHHFVGVRFSLAAVLVYV